MAMTTEQVRAACLALFDSAEFDEWLFAQRLEWKADGWADAVREVSPNVGRFVAEELRAAREAAWYEGHAAGAHDEAFGVEESNPYCLEGES